jgi:hypothetical protein
LDLSLVNSLKANLSSFMALRTSSCRNYRPDFNACAESFGHDQCVIYDILSFNETNGNWNTLILLIPMFAVAKSVVIFLSF